MINVEDIIIKYDKLYISFKKFKIFIFISCIIFESFS